MLEVLRTSWVAEGVLETSRIFSYLPHYSLALRKGLSEAEVNVAKARFWLCSVANALNLV